MREQFKGGENSRKYSISNHVPNSVQHDREDFGQIVGCDIRWDGDLNEANELLPLDLSLVSVFQALPPPFKKRLGMRLALIVQNILDIHCCCCKT